MLPIPRVIACDVDGTLLIGSSYSAHVIAMLRRYKEQGFSITLWSMRGEEHARTHARGAGIEEICDHIISKPGYLIDDAGWSWTRYTRCLPLPSSMRTTGYQKRGR
jgi:hydroxymethylpyrimidine pyrophosphatase-like HAD family hydrolase